LRRRARVAGVLIALAGLAVTAAWAQGLAPIPPLSARVIDSTGTLTPEQRAALESKLQAFEARKGAQLAVLLVATTAPEAIEQYSIRVVEQWKLGRRNVDDGALLVIAKEDRALRIEAGRGLEGVLTDATSNRIIDEVIKPYFRQGNFYAGIDAGIDQTMRVIDGEPLPPVSQTARRGSPGVVTLLPFLFVAALFGSTLLRAIFGRMLGSALTGGGIGMLAFALGAVVSAAVGVGFIAFLFALLAGSSSRPGWATGPRVGGWGGFGGGGFGGGGFGGGGFGGGGFGGGGGFSGGGGTFSGGGASGRW
jgi:uncharacterized protein